VDGLDEGEELVFERSIVASGTTEYTINSNKVSAEQYTKGLKELGIDIKARNFLVFQGDVDAVAKKNPRAMREYFELFCGSGDLREGFERAEARLEDARKETHTRSTLRRNALIDVRDLRAAKEESEAHEVLAGEVESLRTRLLLVKLYYMDAAIRGKEEECKEAALSLEAAGEEEARLGEKERECAKTAGAVQKLAAKKELQLAAKGQQVREALEAVAVIEARCASLKAVRSGGAEGVRDARANLAGIKGEVEALEDEVGIAESRLEKYGGEGAATQAIVDQVGGGATIAALAGLSPKDREEYSALKTQERMVTADLRDTLGRLGREQSVDDAELFSLKATLEAATTRL